MFRIVAYSRTAAVEYTRKWTFQRDPAYYNFGNLGGDCANFASQRFYAGSSVMNYIPTYGWYYSSSSDRGPSWTGVVYLYQFLTQNKGPGPFATGTNTSEMVPGGIVRLGDQIGRSYHSPIVVAVEPGEIYVAAHTSDIFICPLSSHICDHSRFLRTGGVRKYRQCNFS